MAITGTANGIGGTTLPGLYIRIKNVDIAKYGDEWILSYNVEAFLDASKAGQGGYSVPFADIGSAAMRSANEITDPFGMAYAHLKTRSVITDAVDV